MLERELQPAPVDGVTRVRFSPRGEDIIVASWSGSVGVYEATEGRMRTSLKASSAVLDANFDAHGRVYSAGLDGSIMSQQMRPDGGGGEETEAICIGRHEQGARCLEVSSDSKLIVSGGWDSRLCGWHTDQEKRQSSVPAFSTELPGKVFAMSKLGEWRYIIATSSRRILIFDIRKPSEPQEQRESLLKNQLRCVASLPDETGFAAASTEGRVAIERMDNIGSYTFKCHRVGTYIFPVNAISFHPKWHTFATGGADGNVSVWDGTAKKRICQYPRYETSISSLDFHPEGNVLAIAVSYTFEEGEREHPQDRVLLRTVIDADVQPRVRRA